MVVAEIGTNLNLKRNLVPCQSVLLVFHNNRFSHVIFISFTFFPNNTYRFAAQVYDIRRADKIPDLQDDFIGGIPVTQSDLIVGNLTAPQEFGNIEQFTIRVPIGENDTTTSYAFAIKSRDDTDKQSEVSNVVQATLRQYIPPTGTPPTNPAPIGLPQCAVIGIAVVISVAVIASGRL